MLKENAIDTSYGYRIFEHSPRFWRLVEAAEKPVGLIAAPLLPLSWLYSGAINLYLKQYQLGIKRQSRVNTPIVSVGNLVLGGTGKTSVVRWICESLLEMGVKSCVVSYGYGGTYCHTPSIVSDGENIKLSAAQAGDEPVMLAKLIPGVPVVIGKRRYLAARLAETTFKPDVIILDDGFQHWQLFRDLDILVIDARSPFGNGHTLPAGPLRESIRSIKRADIAILTHIGVADNFRLSEIEKKIKSFAPHISILHASNLVDSIRYLTSEKIIEHSLDGKPLCAVSSIGTPKSFEDTLIEAGLTLKCTIRYPDHHPYTQRDINDIISVAKVVGASEIITTEKDAVRWPGLADGIPVSVLDIRLKVEQGEKLLQSIKNLL